ncbi:MAG: hypothetical protein ACYC69_09005 [Thermodesulfovibrionales bacterium]
MAEAKKAIEEIQAKDMGSAETFSCRRDIGLFPDGQYASMHRSLAFTIFF